MPKKSLVLLPETERILEQMGQQIKYARLRRKLPAELVAEWAGISRATLVSIEKVHLRWRLDAMQPCYMRLTIWIRICC